MHSLLLLLLSVAAIGRGLAQLGSLAEPRLSAHRWIVEIDYNDDLETIKGSATRIVSRFPGVHAVSTPHEYTSDIFYGFSLHCEFTKEISFPNNVKKTLSHIRGVNQVWDSLTYRERSIDSHEYAPNSLSQPAWSEDVKARINSIHNLTQVTDLQLMSLSGNGVTVAVIDGGLDYLHPALGAGFGQGFKVQYGYDFVGDNVRPPNVEAPDNDPYGDCSNHATHTAGILFGDDISIGFRGVAPGVSVEHYRVFDCNGMSTSDVVLQAVLRAVERKVDLINLSLGSGSRPFSDDPLASLVSRINRQRRIFIAVAAGNNGRNGTWSAASPDGGGPDIYAVGSFDLDYSYSILRPGQAIIGNKTATMVELTWNPPTWTAWFNNVIPESIGLVALSEDQDVSQDGCQEIKSNPSLYQDKLVLIRRGGCSLTDKMRNLAQAGGQYVLIYDNGPGPVFDLEIRLDGITGGGSVSSETGSMLLSLLKQESEVRLRLDANLTLPPVITWQTNQQTAGKVSTFNTWGPSGEGYTVTSLLGFGNRVLSTIPRKVGGWGLQSGTSMAVPYIIGCIALLKEAFPNTDSRTIAETLLHTAEPVDFNDGTNTTYNFLASVWQQGAGRVQAYNAFKALQSRIRISETSLHFNDTEFSHKTLSFEITNDGHEAFGYNILSRPAVTVLSLPSTNHRPVPMTPALKVAEASTEFLETLEPLEHAEIAISVAESDTETGATKSSQDRSDLSLAVGQSVTIIITPDTSLLEKFGDLCPLYSGFVDIRGASGLVQSVSYAGIACQVRSLHNLVPDQNTTFLAAATREDAYVARHEGRQLEKAPTGIMFTLPRGQDPKDRKAYSSLVLPTIQVDLSMYSRVIRFDVFPAEDEHHSTPLFTTDVSHRIGGYGRIETHFFHWTGSLPNGSWAYPGKYRIRVSPLRLYGGADSANDYRDIFTTDVFAINYTRIDSNSASFKSGNNSNLPCLEESIELI